MIGIVVEDSSQGAILNIRLQPKARREEIVGLHGESLKVAVRAPPVDGAANNALIRLLSKRLGVARRSIMIISGHTGRSKRVCLHGVEADALRRTLEGMKI